MRWPVLLLMLSGCANQPIIWDAADSPQFRTDDYECTRDATYMPNVVPVPEDAVGFEKGFAEARQKRGPQLNTDLYTQCMEARGYVESN